MPLKLKKPIREGAKSFVSGKRKPLKARKNPPEMRPSEFAGRAAYKWHSTLSEKQLTDARTYFQEHGELPRMTPNETIWTVGELQAIGENAYKWYIRTHRPKPGH